MPCAPRRPSRKKPRLLDHRDLAAVESKRDADDDHDPQDPLLEVLVAARHGHPVLQHTHGEGAE